jgi:hypothetical protein
MRFTALTCRDARPDARWGISGVSSIGSRRQKVTATELRNTIYTHPSSTEALNEALGTVLAR